MAQTTSPKKPGLFELLLTKYRGTFATVVLIPISVVFETYLIIRRTISFWLRTAPKKHNKRVKKVQQQLKTWQNEGCKEKLTTGRSGWFTMSELVPAYKKTNRKIYLNMRDILEIDEVNQTVRVEPQVNMGQLTAALVRKGWTIAVLPELDDLTVGGLVNGFGIETSSHRHGLFQYICKSFEIITPNGELKKCSPTENPELYAAIPWSYGTLGFLVAVELKMVPAKKYVRLNYIPLNNQEELVKRFEKESRDTENYDFVEALVYEKEKGVLLLGKMVDRCRDDGIRNNIRRWYKPWFYKHVEQFLERNESAVEYIPLRQYYHRHTRSLFWMMDHVIPFGNKKWHRFLFGWAMPPQMSLMKYFETATTKTLREKHSVTQDMLVPIRALTASLNHFHDHFNLYPLWLCPMAVYKNQMEGGMLKPLIMEDGTVDEMFVDIGAYGVGTVPNFDGNEALKGCEQFVLEHKGYQAMYAKTLLSKEDFRKMFDHKSYDELRKNIPLSEQAFPEIYDKLSRKARIAPSEYKKLPKK